MDHLGYGLMNVLVTGAQGLLGRHVISMLKAQGAEVTAVGRRREEGIQYCDLLDQRQVSDLSSRIKPDLIIHCAAVVPRRPEDYADFESSCSSLKMLVSVLNFFSSPIVYVSSITVYGDASRFCNPICEDDAISPVSEYGRGKLIGEQLLMHSGRRSIAVRIPGLFGIDRRAGLVFNLLMATERRLDRLVLPADSVQWAGMDVEDAAHSIAVLALSPAIAGPSGFEALNLAYREKYSVSNLVAVVSKICGKSIKYSIKHPNIEFDLSRAEFHGVAPSSTLEDALIKFRDQLKVVSNYNQ